MEELNQPPMKSEYVLWSRAIVDNVPTRQSYQILGKKVTGKLEQCFLRYHNSGLIDPNITTLFELRNSRPEHFIKVSPEVYEMYTKFITGEGKIPLRSIERFIN